MGLLCVEEAAKAARTVEVEPPGNECLCGAHVVVGGLALRLGALGTRVLSWFIIVGDPLPILFIP